MNADLPATHEGWRNYETWAVFVWIANDALLYAAVLRIARTAAMAAPDSVQVCSGIWTVEEARTFLLADRLKAVIEEANPLKHHPSAYADLLASALQDVSWGELAEAFLTEVTK